MKKCEKFSRFFQIFHEFSRFSKFSKISKISIENPSVNFRKFRNFRNFWNFRKIDFFFGKYFTFFHFLRWIFLWIFKILDVLERGNAVRFNKYYVYLWNMLPWVSVQPFTICTFCTKISRLLCLLWHLGDQCFRQHSTPNLIDARTFSRHTIF